MTFCALGIFLVSPSYGQDSHPNDYIRSTRPLKSGGSITSLTSQGQKRSWVNQSGAAEQPRARVASRDTEDNLGRSASSTSFYRQAQAGNAASGIYPYPEAAFSSTANTASAVSRFESDQPAQLRFERAAVGDRMTGDLGNTVSAESLPASFGRQATTPTPAARVAQVAQTPAGSQSRSADSVVNPNATAAAFNSGPNYVNPNLNFAGYQGYQPGAIAANSVPALNTNVARVAKNCCAPAQNCCCTCQPQTQAQMAPFQPFPSNAQAASVGNTGLQSPQAQGFQFQPNIGVPQLSGNTGGGIGSGLYSWLRGSTGSGSSNSLTSLLPFRNMPPSAYLGQGLIGQPTAYVDGQPFRNLLRYVAP